MRFQYRYHYYAAEEEEETEFFYPFSKMCDEVVFRNMFSGEQHENLIFHQSV